MGLKGTLEPKRESWQNQVELGGSSVEGGQETGAGGEGIGGDKRERGWRWARGGLPPPTHPPPQKLREHVRLKDMRCTAKICRSWLVMCQEENWLNGREGWLCLTVPWKRCFSRNANCTEAWSGRMEGRGKWETPQACSLTTEPWAPQRIKWGVPSLPVRQQREQLCGLRNDSVCEGLATQAGELESNPSHSWKGWEWQHAPNQHQESGDRKIP